MSIRKKEFALWKITKFVHILCFILENRNVTAFSHADIPSFYCEKFPMNWESTLNYSVKHEKSASKSDSLFLHSFCLSTNRGFITISSSFGCWIHNGKTPNLQCTQLEYRAFSRSSRLITIWCNSTITAEFTLRSEILIYCCVSCVKIRVQLFNSEKKMRRGSNFS